MFSNNSYTNSSSSDEDFPLVQWVTLSKQVKQQREHKPKKTAALIGLSSESDICSSTYDNSDADPDYELPKKRKHTSTSSEDEQVTKSVLNPVQNNIDETQNFPFDGIDLTVENVVKEIVNTVCLEPHGSANQVETSRGRPRKRKTPAERLAIHKSYIQKKKENNLLNHPIREGCNQKCPKKCSESFPFEVKKGIYDTFWEREWVDRQHFIQQHVSKIDCKRRTKTTESNKKKCSYQYTFRADDGTYKIVCKKMFLNTLGFRESSDKIIRTAFREVESCKNSTLSSPIDNRGKHKKNILLTIHLSIPTLKSTNPQFPTTGGHMHQIEGTCHLI